MSVLDVNLCTTLDEDTLEKLKSKNIHRITEYICKDPEDIVQLTGLQYKDVVSIRNVILAKYSSISVNGSDFYNSVVNSTTILSSGVKSLDDFLDGGLYTGGLTEIAGDIGSGKTQICHHVCATTALQRNQTVIYIDTGASFTSTRMLQMLTQQDRPTQEDILSRIQVYDAFSMHDLLAVLDDIQQNIVAGTDSFYSQLQLIIVDNIASVVYPFLGGRSFAENQGLLCLLGQTLKSLAAEFSTAILTTNNLVRGESTCKTASLGRYWACVPHVRVLINEVHLYLDGTRTLSLAKNSRGVTGTTCQITLMEAGHIT